MKHWAWSVVVVASGLLAAACQQGALSDQDKVAIQKAHDEYAKTVIAEKPDMAGLVKMYYTDTARILPPNMPALDGQAAIVQGYTAMGQFKTFKFGPLSIEGQGSTAYVESTWEGTFVSPGGGEPITETGKGLEVMQKQSDGNWKTTRDMWNADAPPPGLLLPTGALKADARAELKQLDWFAGRWSTEAEAKTASPFVPAGKSTFAMNCRWFPGGAHLICASEGTTPDGPYHEVTIYTYDAEAKAYRGFDTDNTGLAAPFGMVYGKGTWTFTYSLKAGGKPITMRMTLFDLSNDGCSFKQEVSTAGGPFTVVGEGKAKKLPG
jgi:ketosteroid isomerase-like protein